MRSVQIVVTPGSGNGQALDTAQRVQRSIQARGWTSRLDRFEDLGSLGRWSGSCGRSFTHLVCVGGDATMSATAMAAVRHRAPLLPVPCGFGNLFAQAFGHSGDPEAVVGTLESGDVVWIDAGMRQRQGEIFLSHESFGLLDEIQGAVEHNRAQPKPRLLRLLAYYRAGGRFLLGGVPWSIRVEVDGALVARRAALVTVANVRAYGEFLTLTPEASPTDGLLDVFVIPRTTKLALWGRLLKLLLRLPPRRDEVVLVRGRRVSISMPGQPKQDLRVMPGVLPVLVPPRHRERPAPRAAAPDDAALPVA
jgi:diacylglycerol kinase (ATP)